MACQIRCQLKTHRKFTAMLESIPCAVEQKRRVSKKEIKVVSVMDQINLLATQHPLEFSGRPVGGFAVLRGHSPGTSVGFPIRNVTHLLTKVPKKMTSALRSHAKIGQDTKFCWRYVQHHVVQITQSLFRESL